MIVKLTEPQQINGSEISEIDLKLETLKGTGFLELQASYKKYHREYVPVLELDRGFQAFIAGSVSGINPEDLAELLVPDFVEVCTTVQNFLLKSGSPVTPPGGSLLVKQSLGLSS
jgi:hypothetical protein